MLFDSALRRELARTFAATMVVLLTIVITMLLVRSLSLAASDLVEPKDVVLVLGYTALGYLAMILSLSMFVAIVVTLGRMYRESEMAIWFASGVQLSRFVRPVLRTFWPVQVVVVLLLAFAWPWVNNNSELRDRYAQRADLTRVSPGVFQSSADGRRVFFVERDGDDEMQARNVFVLSDKDGQESVVSARSGHMEFEGDDRFIVLETGQRSDIDRRNGESTVAGFERYRMHVDIKALRRAQELPVKAQATIDLMRDRQPRSQGELVWRFGLMLISANLLLLGIGLAHVNQRRPSNWNLVFALLGSLSYLNAVNLTQSWVATGRYGMAASLLALHGGVFVLALLLLWWRDHAAVLHFRKAARREVAA